MVDRVQLALQMFHGLRLFFLPKLSIYLVLQSVLSRG